MRSKTGLARDTSIEVWSAPPMQPAVLTPTRCWPSSRKSLICSLGRRSATRVPSTWRRAVQAIAVKLLSRVTTTSASPSSALGKLGRSNSIPRHRFRGRARHRRRAAGNDPNRDTEEPTESHGARISMTHRNVRMSYICPLRVVDFAPVLDKESASLLLQLLLCAQPSERCLVFKRRRVPELKNEKHLTHVTKIIDV